MIRKVLLIFLILLPWVLDAQTELSEVPDSEFSTDSVIVKKKGFSLTRDSVPWPSPKVAWRSSAILPGAGQIYNKSYWKVPIFYTGISIIGFMILDNHNKYNLYRSSYIAKSKGVWEDKLPDFTIEAVQAQRNYHRQTRDLLVMLGVACYAINIVEAYVDAHMKFFDVSEKIALRVHPAPQIHWGGNSLAWGIKTNIRF